MLKLIAVALFALMAAKPVEDMNLEELQARLVELAGEIAAGGGVPTPEQEAELNAIQARMEAIVSGAIEENEGELQAAEEEAQALDDLYTPPDTMPLDAIGRSFAAALPTEFRGQTCNTDRPDVYQNFTSFYAGKGLDNPPTGQLFFRACGTDEGNNYEYAIDTTDDGKDFAGNVSSMSAERRREEGVEMLTLCGQTAYRSAGFQMTIVPLNGGGVLSVTEWEGPGRPTAERFRVQAEMLNQVKCSAIIRAASL